MARGPDVSQSDEGGGEAPGPALARARERLRAAPQRAEAHGALARELERSRLFGEATQHRRRALELAPGDPVAHKDLGEILLRTGRFEEAAEAFRRSWELDPDDHESGFALAALERRLGRPAEARAILERTVARRPITRARPADPGRPTILRVRSLDRSDYGLVRRPDETYRRLLRGGHFSVSHLVPKGRYNVVVLNVLGDNVNRLDELPPSDLILNTIGCADRAGQSLRTLEPFAERWSHLPLINHPSRVLATARDRNSQRMERLEGVDFPLTRRFFWDGRSAAEALETLGALSVAFPLILREAGSQTGRSVFRAAAPEEALSYFTQDKAGKEHFAIAYRDCRRRDGLFRKMRLFCIDGRFYPSQCVLSESWNIHAGERYAFMEATPRAQAEEASFLRDPQAYLGGENIRRLRRVRDLVGLDFFGIDFTLLGNERLFIFELNPAMRHNFDHVERFPYTRPHLQRISAAFDAMLVRRLAARGWRRTSGGK